MRGRFRSLLLATGLLAPARGVRAALRRRWLHRDGRRRIEQYLSSDYPRKLQLGCGTNVFPGWLNSDRVKETDGVVIIDATRELPFEDSIFDYVFSEHLIEHLEYRDGVASLKECFRILRPGGKIRIATPDLQFLVDLYGSGKSDLQRNYVSWSLARFRPEIDIGGEGDVFVINNFFRDWGHKFIYDRDCLGDALQSAGFSQITWRNVGESDDDQLRRLESHGESISEEFNALETMVIEGLKADG